MDAQLFSTAVGVAVAAGEVVTVALVVLYLRDRRSRSRDALTSWIHRHGLTLAALVAVGATVASFIFSDVIGWPPCTLCWYQRGFMISLAFILSLAAWRKDRAVIRYALLLVGVGGLVALNHVWLQSVGGSFIPCPAPGPGVVSCDQRFVYEFGYLTIPVMSLSGFAFLGALLAHARTRKD